MPPSLSSWIPKDPLKEILCIGEALLGFRDVASHEKRIDSAKFVQAFLFHFQCILVVLLRLAETTPSRHVFRKRVVPHCDCSAFVKTRSTFKGLIDYTPF